MACIELITPATSAPVTNTQVKAYLRITDTSEDTLITSLVLAATRQCEQYMGRAIVSQTWRLTADFSPGVVYLPMGSVSSVTSVIITDDDGTATTQSTAIYNTKLLENACVFLKNGECWTTSTRAIGQFQVNYVAGWAVASVPDALTDAVQAQVAWLYEHRGDESGFTSISPVSMALMQGYRVMEIA
jgi:uncharacterized phiE125 gp8 family phage protein